MLVSVSIQAAAGAQRAHPDLLNRDGIKPVENERGKLRRMLKVLFTLVQAATARPRFR
jgi:hypothetical protein